jgi:hypothetical protein
MVEQPRRLHDDVVAVLGAAPERVGDLVAALDEPRLAYRHGPAFPTLKELIAHVSTSAALLETELRRAYLDMQREVGIRAAIEPAQDPDLARPTAEFLETYARVRRRTVDLIRGLSGQDWKRVLVDPACGELTLTDICDMVAQHELGHLAQVRNLMTLLPEG